MFCSMLLFSLVWFLSELPTTWGVCLESRASSSFSNALASSSVSCEGCKKEQSSCMEFTGSTHFTDSFYNGYFGEPGDEVLLALRQKIRKGSGYSWRCAASVYWLYSLQDAFNLMRLVVVSERSDHMQLPRHYIRVQFELTQVARLFLLCA